MFSRSTVNRLPRKSRSNLVRSCGWRLLWTGVCETCVIGEFERFTAAMAAGDAAGRKERGGGQRQAQTTLQRGQLLSYLGRISKG